MNWSLLLKRDKPMGEPWFYTPIINEKKKRFTPVNIKLKMYIFLIENFFKVNPQYSDKNFFITQNLFPVII